MLPTHLSASTLGRGDLLFSLAGFVLFYTLLFVIEMFLMFKYARQGPTDPPRAEPPDHTSHRPHWKKGWKRS